MESLKVYTILLFILFCFASQSKAQHNFLESDSTKPDVLETRNNLQELDHKYQLAMVLPAELNQHTPGEGGGLIDSDGDGIVDSLDNCPNHINPTQLDVDEDGLGDHCDTDRDGDTIFNANDNCPEHFNPDQSDQDNDGLGDACEGTGDVDDDGIEDAVDNCPLNFNPTQLDADEDGFGDHCDPDRDGDSLVDANDNCPGHFNPDQSDRDNDGLGDACEGTGDLDNDGVEDGVDNCPLNFNPTQLDVDKDGFGDPCDPDRDGDDLIDVNDNCPGHFNPDQSDQNNDGVGDACEEAGDVDGDGVENFLDNCRNNFNPTQLDVDEDGLGDSCDPDRDGDNRYDGQDNCPGHFNPDQSDQDNDGVGDECETVGDQDGDGILDGIDNCVRTFNPQQIDSDSDGVGDLCRSRNSLDYYWVGDSWGDFFDINNWLNQKAPSDCDSYESCRRNEINVNFIEGKGEINLTKDIFITNLFINKGEYKIDFQGNTLTLKDGLIIGDEFDGVAHLELHNGNVSMSIDSSSILISVGRHGIGQNSLTIGENLPFKNYADIYYLIGVGSNDPKPGSQSTLVLNSRFSNYADMGVYKNGVAIIEERGSIGLDGLSVRGLLEVKGGILLDGGRIFGGGILILDSGGLNTIADLTIENGAVIGGEGSLSGSHDGEFRGVISPGNDRLGTTGQIELDGYWEIFETAEFSFSMGGYVPILNHDSLVLPEEIFSNVFQNINIHWFNDFAPTPGDHFNIVNQANNSFRSEDGLGAIFDDKPFNPTQFGSLPNPIKVECVVNKDGRNLVLMVDPNVSFNESYSFSFTDNKRSHLIRVPSIDTLDKTIKVEFNEVNGSTFSRYKITSEWNQPPGVYSQIVKDFDVLGSGDLIIPRSQIGDLYLRFDLIEGAHPISLEVEITEHDLLLNKIIPDITSKNADTFTTSIEGGNFYPQTKFALADNFGTTTLAIDTKVLNPGMVIAEFDISNLQPGNYKLIAHQSEIPDPDHCDDSEGTHCLVHQLVTIHEESESLPLSVNFRSNKFRKNGPGIAHLEIINPNAFQIPSPFIRVSSSDQISIPFQPSPIDSEVVTVINEPGGIPGLISPKSTFEIPVSFSTRDSTNIKLEIINGSNNNLEIPWQQYKFLEPPTGIRDIDWECWLSQVDQFQNVVGETWGDLFEYFQLHKKEIRTRGEISAQNLFRHAFLSALGLPNKSIRGYAVDENGEPLDNYWLTVTEDVDGMPVWVSSAKIKRGVFVVDNLQVDQEYRMVINGLGSCLGFLHDSAKPIIIPSDQNGDLVSQFQIKPGEGSQWIFDGRKIFGQTLYPFFLLPEFSSLTEHDPFSTVANIELVPVGSFDPNETSVDHGDGSLMARNQTLRYTVFFENKCEDDQFDCSEFDLDAAQNIKIVIPLAGSNLDVWSFKPIEFSLNSQLLRFIDYSSLTSEDPEGPIDTHKFINTSNLILRNDWFKPANLMTWEPGLQSEERELLMAVNLNHTASGVNLNLDSIIQDKGDDKHDLKDDLFYSLSEECLDRHDGSRCVADLGILPPSTESEDDRTGHGYFTFEIRPLSNVDKCDIIKITPKIIFDAVIIDACRENIGEITIQQCLEEDDDPNRCSVDNPVEYCSLPPQNLSPFMNEVFATGNTDVDVQFQWEVPTLNRSNLAQMNIEFDFFLWQSNREGTLIHSETLEDTGLLVLDVPAGDYLWQVIAYDPNCEFDDGITESDYFRFSISDSLQIQGDVNSDGLFNLTDVITLLEHLFLGTFELPCGDQTVNHRSNIELLNINTDDKVDLTDAIGMLEHQFLGKSGYPNGMNCISIPECPDKCLE